MYSAQQMDPAVIALRHNPRAQLHSIQPGEYCCQADASTVVSSKMRFSFSIGGTFISDACTHDCIRWEDLGRVDLPDDHLDACVCICVYHVLIRLDDNGCKMASEQLVFVGPHNDAPEPYYSHCYPHSKLQPHHPITDYLVELPFTHPNGTGNEALKPSAFDMEYTTAQSIAAPPAFSSGVLSLRSLPSMDGYIELPVRMPPLSFDEHEEYEDETHIYGQPSAKRQMRHCNDIPGYS